MARIVALLESMWGWGGYYDVGAEAPRFFRINPDNHSGRRLYQLCGAHNFVVTNCCKTVQQSASDHGTPDIVWLKDNLFKAQDDGMTVLLICGKIAKATFQRMKDVYPASVLYLTPKCLFIDHPAARRWSKARIASTAQEIEELCKR